MYNNDGRKRGHCIALFSGGLDSALAIIMMLKQDIAVTAITFMNHFGCDLGDRSSCGSNPYPAAEKFGFDVKLMHLGQKFVDIVQSPRFGHGKEMNPCTDCRILMLNEGKELMEMVNADFIMTGEVMGQRPMSQLKAKLHLTIKETGLQGKLLRPLSAKLLEPTDVELSGMVDREKLEGISGRSRKRQIEMAKEFGLEDYPSPASGCLLTDHGYSNRLRDLLQYREHISFDDLNLLRAGRHFRLDAQTKLIVGRDEKDNKLVMAFKQPHHHVLEAMDVSSPMALMDGEASDENLRKAAMIVARYSSGKNDPEVTVRASRDKAEQFFTVPPAMEDIEGITAVR